MFKKIILILIGALFLSYIMKPILVKELGFSQFKTSLFPLYLETITVTISFLLFRYSCLKIKSLLRKRKDKKTMSSLKKNEFTLVFRAGNNVPLTVDNPFRGIYIQGGAGSGKSDSFFKPILKQFSEMNMAGILYDFKSPDLTSTLYNYYKHNPKVNFAFIDFKDIRYSNRINPISPKIITKTAYAFEIARALIYNLMPENIKQQDFFSRSTISLTAGIIWFFKKNLPTICTLPHVITFILKCPAELLVQIIATDDETYGMISSLKEAVDQKAGKQIAGVLGTLKNAVAPLNIKEVFYILSKDEVDLDLNNPNNPTMLAIGNDSTLPGTYESLISTIITISSKLMNQPNKWPSAIVLDEAPTLFIPNFEQLPATARSNRIATVYGAQDYAQIVDKYGRDKSEALIANLGNQFFGRTTNAKTARMISDIFGKKDTSFTTYSRGKSNPDGIFKPGSSNSGSSKSIQERDVIPIREIKNALPGQFFGIIAEGNYKEWLEVRLNKVDYQETLPPMLEPDPDAEYIFARINQDITRLIEDPKSMISESSISLDIEIKENLDQDDILDDFFDEL